MRRAIIGCCVIGLCYFAWQTFTRRSTTVDIQPPEYSIAYTVAWGMGMDQRLTLERDGIPWAVASTGWVELWDKPYNSGAVMYASEDGETYFFGTGYKLFSLSPKSGVLWSSCEQDVIPKRTPFAERLSVEGRERLDEQIDPGALGVHRFIRGDELAGKVPAAPPQSRYYSGLRYLGRFGIVRPEPGVDPRRGNEVRFVPAGNSPEPRLGLQFSCG
jgi:hypothetical protein